MCIAAMKSAIEIPLFCHKKGVMYLMKINKNHFLYVLASVAVLLFVAYSIVAAENPVEPWAVSQNPEQRDFPSIHIITGLDPFNVDRVFWHPGVVSVSGSANAEYNFNPVMAQIRGRGHSSWINFPEKRPLRIRFDTPQPMFGTQYQARDWTLIANHSDMSLMRNFSAYYFASLLDGLAFSSIAVPVHLYINGEYVGVYNLSDQIHVAYGRVSLVADENPQISEYLLELDFRVYRDNEEGLDFFRVNTFTDQYARDFLYDVAFPGGSVRTAAHVEYAKNFITNVSMAFHSRNFEEIERLVDLPSLIDFYLVNEFFLNGDVGWASTRLQIKGQGESRRLYMGPVWDFDIAAGIRSDWLNDLTPYGLGTHNSHYWFWNLINTPELLDMVAVRWNEVGYAAAVQTINRINYMATYYNAAFLRNFELHPILGEIIFPHREEMAELDTFDKHVYYLIDFLSRRATWLTYFFTYEYVY